MEQTDYQYAREKLAQLKADYQVEVLADWGEEGGTWKPGIWTKAELDRLDNAIVLLANIMGGKEQFVHNLGGVTVRKKAMGSHAGEALAHSVTFSEKGTFSSWTAVHEFAHAWDAHQGWKLSRRLVKYTGGFTNRPLSYVIKLLGLSDSRLFGKENKPGRYGRRRGCNRSGYFYGDKPSGSDWNFNRLEDFAESVAMYIGWGGGNELSEHAHNRIVLYQLRNEEKDPFGVRDYWEKYARLFYPENGDYTKTKRWRFVDELVNGKIVDS